MGELVQKYKQGAQDSVTKKMSKHAQNIETYEAFDTRLIWLQFMGEVSNVLTGCHMATA